MTRDQIIELITQVVGDELTLVRAEVERLVALKPLPPFLPPPSWAAGRHAASTVVRHVNGLFMARRDTELEPPGDDWLPLLVGVAGLEAEISGDRTVILRGWLSDGNGFEMAGTLAVPIFRGTWAADATYDEGDRVMCNGEWHALERCTGIEPGREGSEAAWVKVGGKARAPGTGVPQFALDDEGTMTEAGSGRVVGSIKPLVRGLLVDLAAKHSK